MKYLLDTSALLAHARHEPEAPQVQELFDREDVEILLCSVSLAEMARHLRELGLPEEKNQKIMGDYEDMAAEIVPVNADVARLADQISIKTSSRLPLADALIAAAALSRGAFLVHRDAHMRAVPDGVVQQFDLASFGRP